MKLKKSQIFTITACGIAAVLLTGVLAAGLSGVGPNPQGAGGVRGCTNQKDIEIEEDEMTGLEVKWLDGPVTVGLSPDEKVHVVERTYKPLSEGERMEVSLSSGKLSVRWDGQWFRRWINIGWFGKLNKELEVLLPQRVAENLEEIKVENTSDYLAVTDCGAEKLEVSSVSGSVSVDQCMAEQLQASTVSGELVLTGVRGTEKLSANTTSGEVSVKGGYAQELEITTVSGGVLYEGEAEKLHASTVSGTMRVNAKNCPEEAHMESVSGDLYLGLPENAGFTAEYSSVSGEFATDFPCEKTGGGKARYGSGGAEIRMSTTSGGMTVERER